MATHIGKSAQTNDISRLNGAAAEITKDAAIRHATADIEAEAAEERAAAIAEWESRQKHAQVEKEEDEFDDDGFFDDDATVRDLESKRLAAMKARFQKEKENAAQGTGEYREIVEEDFLKEVTGTEWVVVHFYHTEFFTCKVVDKHMRLIAPKHRGCKFLYLNAEKCAFFVTKLMIQILPTIIVFQNGVVVDQLAGLDELGGKDDFRTEVLEHWLSKQGCLKLKKATLAALARHCDDSDCCDSDASD